MVYQFRARPDGSTYFSYASPRAGELFGFPDDLDSEGWELGARLHPDDRESFFTSISQAIERCSDWNYEGRMFLPDGGMKWFQGISSPTRIGEELVFNGILLDITERKRAEEAYRVLVETSLQSLVIVQAGRIVFANPAAEVMSGYTVQELMDMENPVQTLIHPDDLSRIVDRVARRNRGEAVPPLAIYRIVQKSGQARWVESYTKQVEFGGKPADHTVYIDITDRKQAMEALRTSEQQYREQQIFLESIYHGVESAIFVIDVTADGSFRYAGHNKAHQQAMGLKSEDFIGKTPEDLIPHIPPDVAASVRANYQRCVDLDKTLEYDEKLIIENQELWVMTRLTPLKDERGRIYRMIGVSTDITEHKRAEGKIRQQVEELQRWYRLMMGREQQIQALKDEVNDLLGRLHEPIRYPSQVEPLTITQSADDVQYAAEDTQLVLPASCDIPPEIAGKWQEIVNVIAALIQVPAALIMKVEPSDITVFVASHSDGNPYERGEKAPLNTGLYCETVMRTRQQLLVPNALEDDDWKSNPDIELGMISYLGLPVTWPDGTIFGTICVLDNKTNAYNPLSQKVLEQFRAIIEADLRLFFDHDLHLAEEQRTKLDESEQARHALLSVLEDQKRIEQELRIHREHLKELVNERTRELSAAIEAAEEAQQAAETANRAKSMFLANMSHELRTPMNAILGFSQLMAREPDLTNSQRENLAIINRSGEHLLMLINDILDMSKIEAGQSGLEVSSFDLDRTLTSIEDMLRLRAEQKNLELVVERAPDLPRYIRTDERKLRQVLINLLSNAVKFTEKGHVSLRVSELHELHELDKPTTQELKNSKTQKLFFEISDTGIGISADELEHIFDPFVQTTISQKASEGTGLGLAISRQFVQLMGGELTATSQPGEGSVFTFTIQAETVEAPQVEQQYTPDRVMELMPNQHAPDGGPYRILITEDEEFNRVFLQRLLEIVDPSGQGFDVRTAINGQEALEIVEQWQPHLIFMDMRMPVMDGYTATWEIRKAEEQKLDTGYSILDTGIEHPASSIQHPASSNRHRTLIIALTASVFEEDRKKVLATGCDDFVRKPFKEEDIFSILGKHLGIQFVYEEEAKGEGQKVKGEEVLTPEALVALPPGLLADLEQVTNRSDMQQIITLIEEIRTHDPAVADALKLLADEFQYDEILRLIQKARSV